MIYAQEIFDLQPTARGILINKHAQTALNNAKDEIDRSVAHANVLNTFISQYIQIKIQNDLNNHKSSIFNENNITSSIKDVIDAFKPDVIKAIEDSFPSDEELISSKKNLFELSGAKKLAVSNRVTRNIVTKWGLLWERIASISPYAISPEKEFDIKLAGIDLIIHNFHSEKLEYLQLKTAKNTLTGSQVPRSKKELEVHENPIFCACFDTRSSWTFKHETIPRIVGEEFWSRIRIPYEEVLSLTKNLILELEENYARILDQN
jgi:hypothetical protein